MCLGFRESTFQLCLKFGNDCRSVAVFGQAVSDRVDQIDAHLAVPRADLQQDFGERHCNSDQPGNKSLTTSRSDFNSLTERLIFSRANSLCSWPGMIFQVVPLLVSGKPTIRSESMP